MLTVSSLLCMFYYLPFYKSVTICNASKQSCDLIVAPYILHDQHFFSCVCWCLDFWPARLFSNAPLALCAPEETHFLSSKPWINYEFI
jgi:hypothetical protein